MSHAHLNRHVRHAKDALARARAEAGAGWALLSPRLRSALVALHAMHTLASREDVSGWEDAAYYAQTAIDVAEGGAK